MPRIVLAVTVDKSLVLLRGFPEYLADCGWDVHVVCSPGPSLGVLARSPGVTTHALSMAREPSLLADLKSLVDWVRLLRALRPDVISVGTPKAGLLGGIAGWFTRVPRRVYLLRGLRLETTTGVRRAVLRVMEMLSMKVADQVLAVSQSLRSRALELRLVKPEKILVLGSGSSNGVDVDVHSPENFSSEELSTLFNALGLVGGVPVIGFVGRLTHDKGLEVLADAREILAKAGKDHQLLLVGGVDDDSGSSSLESSQAELRPIVATGHIDGPEIYYQLMDVFCLPTLREGFPNVVLEAAASGVPAVTTTATGAIDSVIAGETGLVADVGSAESLARQLAILLDNVTLRLEMGSNASRYARAEFSRPHVWALMEGFYAKLDSQANA